MPIHSTSRSASRTRTAASLAGLLLVLVGCIGNPFVLGNSPSGSPESVPPGSLIPDLPSSSPIATATGDPTPPSSPPSPGLRQITMGIAIPDGLADKDAREAQVIQSLDRLAAPTDEGGLGRYPGAFSFWTNFGEYGSPYSPRASFPSSTLLSALDERGITPIINLAPVGPGIDRSPTTSVDTATPYSNASIAAGSFDDFLRTWAEAAAAYGKTVILRYAHEMNGTWFPWSPTQDRTRYFDLGNTPGNYVTAWRHVYTLIHGIAPNVKFFWCPTVTGIETAKWFYPGSQYVDYIGVDGYARGKAQTMGSVLGAGLASVRTLPGAATLPLMVGETGVLYSLSARGQWLSTGYQALYRRFPQLAGIVYFDFNMTDVFGQDLEPVNWRLETDPAAVAAYALLGSDRRFQGTLTDPASTPAPTPSPSLGLSIEPASAPPSLSAEATSR
jgi:hypothetical protein